MWVQPGGYALRTISNSRDEKSVAALLVAPRAAQAEGMNRAWAVALGILLVECNGETAVREVARRRLSQHKVGFIPFCATAVLFSDVDN